MTTKKAAPKFDMKPVKSSQIESVGHQFQKAESAGKFLGASIRGKFKFTKV